jgi:transposase
MDNEDEMNPPVMFQPRKRPGRPKNDDRLMVPSKVVKGTMNAVVVQHYPDAQGRQGKGWVEAAPRDSRAHISAEEKVAFLRCVAGIRRMVKPELRLVVRNAQGQYEGPAPVSLACKLLGISDIEGNRIHAEFQKDKLLPETNLRGSYERKLLLNEMFGNAYIESWVRLTIMKCKEHNTRPNYRSITAGIQELAFQQAREEGEALGMEIEEGFLPAAITYQKVRRWCQLNNWLFTKITKRSKATLETCARMNALYAAYAEHFFAESENENSVAIYQDESYCNEKHSQAYAVLNPDEPDTWPDYIKDGRRWCFSTAICEKGEIATLDSSNDSRWMFCPNKDQQKKADYHSSFDADNFVPYFRDRLLPACERVFPGKRLVFIMDNAGYHISSTFQLEGEQEVVHVKRSSRKELLVRFITHHRGEGAANTTMLRPQLEALFAQITTELGCDIYRLLREKGHALLLTPPRCSTWQPIELYWASVKNDVARQYRQGRSLQETKDQLQASLTKWGNAEHCSKLIAHTTKLLKTWWDSARRADTAAETNADAAVIISDSDDSDSDDGLFSIHSHEILDD